jgi:hypothetical protein
MAKVLTNMQTKLGDVLELYEKLHPMTYNHYFTETIQKARNEQFQKSMSQRFRSAFGSPNTFSVHNNLSNVSLERLVSTMAPSNIADMELYAASELAYCMEAYYKVISDPERYNTRSLH